MPNKLSVSAWYGGKARFTDWINGILPPRRDVLYCEPFSGMASVLLNRPKSKREIYNDINGRLVNLFRVLRDNRDELLQMLEFTLISDDDMAYAVANQDNPDLSAVQRAWCTLYICKNSMMHTDSGSTLRMVYESSSTQPINLDMIKMVHSRLRHVQILNQPAVKLMERISIMERVDMYVDPPYLNADTSPYTYGDIDMDSLTNVLLAQKGRVAISGYDEWEHLNWKRYELETHFSKFGTSDKVARTEIIWTNYD